MSVGDDAQCHLEKQNTGEEIHVLHGSPSQICSIQINASLGYYIGIEISNSGMINDSFPLYIERLGELDLCTNRYVVFYTYSDTCSAILLQKSIHLNIQGDVNILITGISAEDSNPVCPESRNKNILPGSRVNQTQDCEVKGYTDHFTCSPIFGYCKIEFQFSCSATLGHRRVSLECLNHDLHQPIESMITFKLGMHTLYLRDNNIVNLEGRPFQSLNDLLILFLDRNLLTTLHSGVFSGLSNLIHLYLSDNQLGHLDSDQFKNLDKLTCLYIERNRLVTLPNGVFNDLRKLDTLDLCYNQLALLPDKIFNELKCVKSLRLTNNELITLPSSIFKGLINLHYLRLNDNKLVTLPNGVFSRLSYLKDLFLDNNQIVTLPNSGLRATRLFFEIQPN